MRAAKPPPSANINTSISNSSVEGLVPSFPIAEPQLLAPTLHLSAMTPRCAPEPPVSDYTTVGANSMLQSYATPSSVAQSTHGQRQAAHDPPQHPCPVPALAGQFSGIFRATINLTAAITTT